MLDFDIDDASVSPAVQSKWHYCLESGLAHVLDGFTYTGNESFSFIAKARTASPYTAYYCPEEYVLNAENNTCTSSNQYETLQIPAFPVTEYVYGEYQVVDNIDAVPNNPAS